MNVSRHFPARDIRKYNYCLDRELERRWGMSFKAFKIIKASTQMLGVAAGVYAMVLGADPMFSFVLIAGIVGGPELLEAVVSWSDAEGDASE